jgi:tetratricopeptide (TPR) repeat protein
VSSEEFIYDHPLIPYAVVFDAMHDYDIPEEVDDILQDIHFDVREGKRWLINPLKNWIKEYPHLPIFKNHLYQVYMIRGKRREAYKVVQDIRKQHPEYIHGLINEVGLHIQKKNFESARILLGESLLIQDCFPEKDRFHISQIIGYYQAVIRLLLEEEKTEEAKKYNDILLTIDENHPAVIKLTQQIAIQSLQQSHMEMMELTKKEFHVKARPKTKYPRTKQAPVFHHTQIESLYQYSEDDFPEHLQNEIVALPEETLAEDLKKVLIDSIQRYPHFLRRKKRDGFWDAQLLSFPTCVFNFLAILKYEALLPVSLELFRQKMEFFDFWFGDYMINTTLPYLTAISERQLQVFHDFMLEEHVCSTPKAVISEAATQLAFHQPEYLPKVEQWFESILSQFIDQLDNKKLIDSAVISCMVGNIVDLRLTSLLPLIKRLFDTELLLGHMSGNYEEIKTEMETPVRPFDKWPLPANITEAFDKSYLERRAVLPPSEESLALMKAIDEDPYTASLMNILAPPEEELYEDDDVLVLPHDDDFIPFYDEEPQLPAKSTKVSRNAPCPCGSGKKYKRCCGKK